MDGKELFTRTIDFKSPDYIPALVDLERNFLHDQNETKWEIIEQLLAEIGQDNICSMSCWDDRQKIIDGVVYREDEWGTHWIDDGHGAFTTYHPMENGYEDIDKVVFPDAAKPVRFTKADSQLANRRGRYMLGLVWFTLFERMWMLRGFTNLLMDPYGDEEEDFFSLKQKVLDVNLAMIDQWIARDVDGVYFSDDWGTQRSLLINPDEWRRLYKEDYAKMFAKVRKAGKHVWMHLCGNVSAILPDLIEIGLNVLNPVQPQAMDVDELSRCFRGKLCFNGGVDVQGTLINGSPSQIKKELKHLIDIFGGKEGGYIINTSHSIMPETPLDNVIALLEGILEYRKL